MSPDTRAVALEALRAQLERAQDRLEQARANVVTVAGLAQRALAEAEDAAQDVGSLEVALSDVEAESEAYSAAQGLEEPIGAAVGDVSADA